MTSKLIMTLFCLMTVFTSNISAQSISFDYDESGNCKLKYKTVVLARAQAKLNNDKQKNPSDSTLNQVSNFGERKIIIYPNPTKGLLNIELTGKPLETKAEYRLTDLSGKLIMHGQFDLMRLSLDLSHLLPGTYMLHIDMESKKDVWKIIKE